MADKKLKSSKQVERHMKGAANHYRIEILLLIDKSPGLALEDISGLLDANIKTISQHTRELSRAGLVNKRYVGRNVQHSLSPYGRVFARFIKSFRRL